MSVQHLELDDASQIPAPCNDTIYSPDLHALLRNVKLGAEITELHAQLMEIVFDRRNDRLRLYQVREQLLGPLTEIGKRARAIGNPPVEANYRQ